MNTQERKDKCVYVHKLNGVVVYVGSGSIQRSVNTSTRSRSHLMMWNDLEKVVIESNLSENEARDKEQRLIHKYWDTGLLLNKIKDVSKTKVIDWNHLLKYVKYSEDSPSGLVWSCKRIGKGFHKRKLDQPVGHLKPKGHWEVKIDNVTYMTHRVVWCICNQKDLSPDLAIDHIDRNPSNNKIYNLRAVTPSENNKNRKVIGATGFQYITESESKQVFVVIWKTKEYKHYHNKCFSYKNTRKSKSPLRFETRDQALAAAITYRDSLVSQGLIELTGE